jgi:hypothetical protein
VGESPRPALDHLSALNYRAPMAKASVASLVATCWLASVTTTSALQPIRVSPDGTHFVREPDGERFVAWGVNYDHDEAGRLLDEYWIEEWPTVVEDFNEIRDLGANCVRIHLQFGKFMDAPDQPNPAKLRQLAKLVKLAEDTGLYLNVTGLACYHKTNIPAWYDRLSETDRWAAQAAFWRAVATACAGSPAIFCYDLMNEPIVAGQKVETEWLGGELAGKFFVQRITLDLAGRTREEVAKAWVKQLTDAIREVDPKRLITVGVIPWSHVWKNAKPFFYAPDVGAPLDFVSVHFYPKARDIDASVEALKVYDIGKPLVVEEIFPLKSGIEETGEFIERSRPFADGWISFYWGKTIEECEKAGDLKGAIVAQWLRHFKARAPSKSSQ